MFIISVDRKKEKEKSKLKTKIKIQFDHGASLHLSAEHPIVSPLVTTTNAASPFPSLPFMRCALFPGAQNAISLKNLHQSSYFSLCSSSIFRVFGR